jgi:hypothetical protein
MPSSRRQTTAALLTALMLSLACSLSPTINVPSQGSSETGSADVGGDTPEGPPHTLGDQWIGATHSLRSITLALVTTFPDSDPVRISAEVDDAGNVHLMQSVTLPSDLPATPPSEEWSTFEFYLIDGVAYSRASMEGLATPDDAAAGALEQALSGPDSPAFWLSLLPEDAMSPSGSETISGFEATRYNTDGQIKKGTVAGTVWLENGSEALVGANLTVSESLFFPQGTGHAAEVSITLTVERAEVPEITLP